MTKPIDIEHLTHLYGKNTPFATKALDDVSLSIAPGEFLGIIGHTGSGKSTLVQHLNGLLKPDSGKVKLGGGDIWEDPKKIREVRFEVGMVFQYPEHQLFEETVFKDIAFGPKNMGLSEDEIKERVYEAMEFCGLERELCEVSPFELSGGQKRRVAIAGVIAMRPGVLVLDEPTAGLDPRGCAEILSHIVEYKQKRGATVVLVTHNMEEIARLVSRIVVLKGGKIALEGTPGEVFAQAEAIKAAGLSVPQITQVFLELKRRGFAVDTSIYTLKQAKEYILSKRRT